MAIALSLKVKIAAGALDPEPIHDYIKGIP
jgi:hypothetical protein